MLGDLISAIVEVVHYLWPFRFIRQWEGGGYYVFGKWMFPVKTHRIYIIAPFFTDLHTCTIVDDPVETGRLDITLRGGSTLSFSVGGIMHVSDPYLALNTVEDYKAQSRIAMRGVIAKEMSEVDPERIEPDRRTKLTTKLMLELNKATEPFGVTFTQLWFNSLIFNVKTHRLIMDQDHVDPSAHHAFSVS